MEQNGTVLQCERPARQEHGTPGELVAPVRGDEELTDQRGKQGINYKKVRVNLCHEYVELTDQHGKQRLNEEKMTVQRVNILVNQRKVLHQLEDQMSQRGEQET